MSHILTRKAVQLFCALALIFSLSFAQAVPTLNKKVMLLVSLGMPQQTVQLYLDQSSRLGVPLIIRGLINNDFKTTMNMIAKLMIKENGMVRKTGMAIDPHPFRDYNIQSVPALIVTDGINTDIVYGNLSLDGLLEKIEQNGSTDALRNLAKEKKGAHA